MNPFFYDKDKEILFIDSWIKEEEIIAGFTTKYGGYSKGAYASNNQGLHVGDSKNDVVRNRELLAKNCGTSLQQWIFAEQIHDSNIHIVTEQDGGRGAKSLHDVIADIDGLITIKNNKIAALMFADCVPIFMYSKIDKVAAILHAGWKGSVKEIAKQAIKQLDELGVSLKNLEIVIGPAICKTCYEVSEEVINQIPKKHMECYEIIDNAYHLDLKQLNYLQLKDSGIDSSQIVVSNYCTVESDLFFSHRGDNGKTGRMLGFIGFK